MYKRIFLILAMSFGASAQENISIDMFALTPEGQGEKIGTITAKDSASGIELIPDLKGLTPGEHGFHLHQDPNCGPADQDGMTVPGLAAKGHFDPEQTGVHEGPAGKGHLGDLPALIADQEGSATIPIVALRLKTGDLKGHSLIIHSGGDNYSDIPNKLGGGGARFACGVVP